MDGFSLHAARTVEADDREGLERLCRYGLRSPLSLERLSVDSEGRVQYMAELSGRSSARTKPMPFGYRLRKPWFDGRTEIVFDIDVLTCPKCDASMTIIAFLTDHNVLTKILDHLKGHQVTKTAFHAIQEGSVPGRDVPVRSLQPFHDTDEVFTNSQARFGGR